MYNYSNCSENMQIVCNPLKQFESLQNVSLAQQRIQNESNFPKSCYNCKHKRYGYHNVSDGPCDRWGGLDSYDYAGICIRSGHTFWEPGVNINIKYSNTKTSVSAELLQCNTNEETLEVARKHGLVIDLTKQEEPDQKSKTTTFIDLRADLDNTPLMDIGIRKVYETEHSRTVVIENKPEKKYTVYDMYDLVFPDDPIQAYFAGVYGRIEKECQEGIDFWDRVQVKPVECPVRALAESKEKPHTLEAVRDWLEFESYLVCGTAGAFPLVSTTVAVVFFFEGGLKDAAESVLLTGASFAAAFLVVSAVSFLRFLIMNGREG